MLGDSPCAAMTTSVADSASITNGRNPKKNSSRSFQY